MKKRIWSIALAAVMLLGLLSGCGGKDQGSSQGGGDYQVSDGGKVLILITNENI